MSLLVYFPLPQIFTVPPLKLISVYILVNITDLPLGINTMSYEFYHTFGNFKIKHGYLRPFSKFLKNFKPFQVFGIAPKHIYFKAETKKLWLRQIIIKAGDQVLAATKILPLLLLAIAMFYYPQEVLKSATYGLNLWVNYVLPALLPFFIISDLLMKQGFVQFLGVLLEPLMRPLFGLPGKAAFVVAMTHTSGIPIGAVLTSKLRKTGDLTKVEGERLLAFTSNPSPGFMFGAVASGMLANPALGIVIAGSVYIANLIVGILFRFYGRNTGTDQKNIFSLRKAWYELETSQKKNNKPFGQILADAVRESISTVLLVGGFIVFFAVLTHMLTLLQVNTLLAKGVSILSFGLLSPANSEALTQGLLETTLGCQAVVNTVDPLTLQIGLITFLLGWGGISVFAQVGSFIASTDLRFLPFILGRTLHAVLALIISQILLLTIEIPTIAVPLIVEQPAVWLSSLRLSALYFIVILSVLVFSGLVVRIWQRIICHN